MANIDISSRPYYDDFNQEKKFHQILFRPSFAIQARELNQLQSVLQNQISRFGSHVFNNGSVVVPGGFSCQNDLEYVTIFQDQNNTGSILSQGVLDAFTGLEVFTATVDNTDPDNIVVTKKVTARIVRALAANPQDPLVLYIKYQQQDPVTLQRTFAPDDVLYVGDISTVIHACADLSESRGRPINGYATAFTTFRGVYFVNGYFVISDDDIVLVDKFRNNASAKVGFTFTADFITPSEDSSLFDNAEDSINFTAPGAHRLKIDLPLTVKALTDDSLDETFIQLAKIENGVITQESRRSDYSVLGDELARRTYDESGNYIVDPFVPEIRDHLNTGLNRGVFSADLGGFEDKYAIDLDPGKAYVFGYEVQTISRSLVVGNKSRNVRQVNNGFINAPTGYYVRVNPVAGNNRLPQFSSLEAIQFHNMAGTLIGSARIRNITKISNTEFYFYIFAVSITSGSFADVVTVRQASTGSICQILTANILEAQDNTLVYKLPYRLISSIKDQNNLSDTSYAIVRQFTGTTNGSGVATISAAGQEEFLPVNSNDFIAVSATGLLFSNATFANIDPTTLQITIPGQNNVAIRVTAALNVNIGIEKRKILATNGLATVSNWNPQSSDLTQRLNKADVVSVQQVTLTLPGETLDITSLFSFNNGQTDSFYDRGSVTASTRNIYDSIGNLAGAGTLTVRFSFYNHVGTGDYFSVDSYADTMYENIPTYISSSGDRYDLRDCLDFRPRISDDGTSFTGVGSSFARTLKADSSVRADFSYFLSRIDKLVLTSNGQFKLLEGTPSETPVEPKDLQDAMSLFVLYIPAYTFTAKEISVKTIDNRRYTMRDIGALESRIQNIEYYTSLNLLEKDTKDLEITDANGLDRFKNGFVVDNFTTQNVADTQNMEYQFAVDNLNGLGGPIQSIKNLNLDVTTTSGLRRINDLVFLDFIEEPYIRQNKATRVERVTPYDVYGWVGIVRLTPETDSWFSTAYAPDSVKEEVVYIQEPSPVLAPPTQPAAQAAAAPSPQTVPMAVRSGDNTIANNSGSAIFVPTVWVGVPVAKTAPSVSSPDIESRPPVVNSGSISTPTTVTVTQPVIAQPVSTMEPAVPVPVPKPTASVVRVVGGNAGAGGSRVSTRYKFLLN